MSDTIRAVWKFEIPITDTFVKSMPSGAELLSVQVQHEQPMLWALVDPRAERVSRKFALVGTGHEHMGPWGRYVGTFQLRGGALVFHLFDHGER